MSDITVSPEAFLSAIELTARRRKTALDYTMMLVANGKLPAWSAFDYAYALDRFLVCGLPPRDIPQSAVARRRKRTDA